MRLSIEENEKLSKLYIEKVLVEMDVGGVMGGSPVSDELENQDDYAPGDNRVPYAMGRIQTRTGAVKKKKGKKLARNVRPNKL